MKELLNQLMEKANLDEMAAGKAVEVVKSFLEEKLPAPIKSQVMNALDGIDLEDDGGLLDKAKGLLGK